MRRAFFFTYPYNSRFFSARSGFPTHRSGQVAQLVEQRTENPCVAGSIPALATKIPALVCKAVACVALAFAALDARADPVGVRESRGL